MKKTEITKLMAIIAETYPGFEVSELKVGIFMQLLSDLSYEVAEKAMYSHILQCKYPPTVADIKKQAIEIMNPQLVSLNTALAEVDRAIKDLGIYKYLEAVQSLSPLPARVVKSIGFREMCLSGNQSIVRGQFIKLYSELLKEETDKLMTPMKYRELASAANSDNLIEGNVEEYNE